MTYRIREVDGEDYADELEALHRGSFDDGSPVADFSEGFWWIAWHRNEPVAFIGVKQSILSPHIGYFTRVGVLPLHRGKGLQRRLMRAMETKAWRHGWTTIVTDTHHNTPSANNILSAGYKLFDPDKPWSFNDALYWTKDLT